MTMVKHHYYYQTKLFSLIERKKRKIRKKNLFATKNSSIKQEKGRNNTEASS